MHDSGRQPNTSLVIARLPYHPVIHRTRRPNIHGIVRHFVIMAMAVTTATAMVVNMILLMLVVLLLRAVAICANVLVRVPCCVHQQTNLFGCADFCHSVETLY